MNEFQEKVVSSFQYFFEGDRSYSFAVTIESQLS